MTMENGFSSTRHDIFPAGVRVLVVDDDSTWLQILEKMLKKCSYEVTTCGLARDALKMLRERKDAFDIVLSDVNMPDMDGFILLELVGLEMDLPVIMMSVDGETRRVMRGVQHGACDYLLKPIRMKELRNIWQHVLRKRINEIRDMEHYESMEGVQIKVNGLDPYDDCRLLSGGDSFMVRKRKDDDTTDDNSFTKKPRVFWTVDLHQKFVRAVNQIGFEKVGPKKILDLMDVAWLTRENIASHLQKYRLYLSRLQKENDVKASCNGAMYTDLCLKNPTRCFSVQDLYGFSANKTVINDADPNFCEGHLKSMLPDTTAGSVHQKVGTTKICMNNSFLSQIADENHTGFNFTTPSQHSWAREEHQQTNIQIGFQNDSLKPAPSVYVIPITEIGKMGSVEIKPSYDNSFSQTVIPMVDRPPLLPASSATLSRKTHGLSQNWTNNTADGANASLGMDLQVELLQGDYFATNIGLQNIDFRDYNETELITNLPLFVNDDLRFDHISDSMEYPTFDRRLIA